MRIILLKMRLPVTWIQANAAMGKDEVRLPLPEDERRASDLQRLDAVVEDFDETHVRQILS